MTRKGFFLRNPEIIIITLVALTIILTIVLGLSIRRHGDAVPTDQNYIGRHV